MGLRRVCPLCSSQPVCVISEDAVHAGHTTCPPVARLCFHVSPALTPQVAQLETQLAAAERCAAELRELTATLGSARQDDVAALKVCRSQGLPETQA